MAERRPRNGLPMGGREASLTLGCLAGRSAAAGLCHSRGPCPRRGRLGRQAVATPRKSFLAGFSRIWPDKIYSRWHECWQVVESSGQGRFEPCHLGGYEVNGEERAGKGARWRRLVLCYGMTGFHHGTKGDLCGLNMPWLYILSNQKNEKVIFS